MKKKKMDAPSKPHSAQAAQKCAGAGWGGGRALLGSFCSFPWVVAMAVLFRVCRPYKVIVGLCLLTCRFYGWIVWHGPTDKTTRVADYHDGLILSYTQELTCASNRLARVVCGCRTAALIWHQQGQNNLSQGMHENLLRLIVVVCGLRPTALTECSWLNDSLDHSARGGPTCLEPIPQSVWAAVFLVPEQTGNFRGQARWTSLRTLAGAGDGHQVIKDVLAHVTDHHEHADRKQSLNDSRKTALSGLVGKELLEAPARRPFALQDEQWVSGSEDGAE